MPKREIVEEGNPETGTVIHEREVRPGLNWAGVIRRAGMVSSELDNLLDSVRMFHLSGSLFSLLI